MLKLEIFEAEGVFFIPDGVWRYDQRAKNTLCTKRFLLKFKIRDFCGRRRFLYPRRRMEIRRVGKKTSYDQKAQF